MSICVCLPLYDEFQSKLILLRQLRNLLAPLFLTIQKYPEKKKFKFNEEARKPLKKKKRGKEGEPQQEVKEGQRTTIAIHQFGQFPRPVERRKKRRRGGKVRK